MTSSVRNTLPTACSVFTARLAMLGLFDVNERLEHAAQVFSKISSISEVSRKISSSIDESLSKQQKEFFLRQQLAAIQRELQTLRSDGPSSPTSPNSDAPPSELDDNEQADADDMSDLKRKIEAMAPGSEERKMGAREWKRLKRIPQGSVENGVIRSYVGIPDFFSSASINRLAVLLHSPYRFAFAISF